MNTQKLPFILLITCMIFASAMKPAEAQQEQQEKLFATVSSSNVKALSQLLAGGVDVNMLNRAENTPLMVAAKIGDHKVINTLLTYNADPNIVNKAGATALMIAAKYGHTHVVTMLLEHGANPLITNNNGDRASTFALYYKHKELYDKLMTAEKQAPESVATKVAQR